MLYWECTYEIRWIFIFKESESIKKPYVESLLVSLFFHVEVNNFSYRNSQRALAHMTAPPSTRMNGKCGRRFKPIECLHDVPIKKMDTGI